MPERVRAGDKRLLRRRLLLVLALSEAPRYRLQRLDDIHSLDDQYDHDVDELMG
jgi:hypothetical protein